MILKFFGCPFGSLLLFVSYSVFLLIKYDDDDDDDDAIMAPY